MNELLQKPNRHVKILLVEDSRNDAFLLREVLKHIKHPVLVDTVPDGAEALDYLQHEGMYKSIELPDVIVLDLNLPKVSGYEVLKVIKADPEMADIPVLIVTGSWQEEIASQVHEFKKTFYLVKPLFLTEFPMLLRTIDQVL